MTAQSLDLALVGNGAVAALLDERAEMVWACLPRIDGDPVFCSLLRERTGDDGFGFFAVELADFSRSEQAYLPNTPIVATRLYDRHGGAVEIVDLAPRMRQFGRLFCPMTLVRQLRPLAGSPRIRVLLRPAADYGARRPAMTYGSNHVRYVGTEYVLRVTTDCSITALVDEVPFVLQRPIAFVLGPDETLQGSVADVARRFQEETVDYWFDWVRDLSIPFEWQGAVIRAALTLKLCGVDDTGAIVAAVTTSVPEAPASGRNWDYRYCWLRDSYFVIQALNRLGATRTMEGYLRFIDRIVASCADRDIAPLYSVSGEREVTERIVPALRGYRGMGPVRIGNHAWLQRQHDVYGAIVLASAHSFFDERLTHLGDAVQFGQLECMGERALAVHDQPDAGPWEFRGFERVHTFSAAMCWAGVDRLARIARRLGLEARAAHWRDHAAALRENVLRHAWSDTRHAFTSSYGNGDLDATALLLPELGIVDATDPRFLST
ncbi:MAG: glycoside hydrolase family 15 protein, partial [Bacteroidota bacterium]